MKCRKKERKAREQILINNILLIHNKFNNCVKLKKFHIITLVKLTNCLLFFRFDF